MVKKSPLRLLNNTHRTPPLVVYHSRDLDGLCSGAIANFFLKEAELVGYDYGQEFPWHLVETPRPVIMMDVSLPVEDMVNLDEMASTFVFIDHHASIIKALDEAKISFKGILNTSYAACELAWTYFSKASKFKDQMPLFVHLLGRYDVWDHEMPLVKPFQYAMRHYIQGGVTDPLWDKLFDPITRESIMDDMAFPGRLLYESHVAREAREARSSFESKYQSYRLIACNKSRTNSDFFASVWDPEKHDIMCLFAMEPDMTWKISLYTTKEKGIDVSEICVQEGERRGTGGGGHVCAAGFTAKELPSWLQPEKPFPLGMFLNPMR